MVKTVQKANKQLRVADDRLEDMQKAGYFEVDGKTGKRLGGPAKEESAAALKQARLTKLENEQFCAKPKAPVHSIIKKEYPKINPTFKSYGIIDWVITFLPAIACFLPAATSEYNEIDLAFAISLSPIITLIWALVYRFAIYSPAKTKRIEKSHKYRKRCIEIDRETRIYLHYRNIR